MVQTVYSSSITFSGWEELFFLLLPKPVSSSPGYISVVSPLPVLHLKRLISLSVQDEWLGPIVFNRLVRLRWISDCWSSISDHGRIINWDEGLVVYRGPFVVDCGGVLTEDLSLDR